MLKTIQETILFLALFIFVGLIVASHARHSVRANKALTKHLIERGLK